MDARLRLELLRQFAIRRNMVEMQAARDAMRIPDETIVGVDSSQQKLITIDPEGNVRLQKTLSNATAGTGVKSLPKGGQTGTFKPTRVPEVEPVPAEEIDIEKLHIAIFFSELFDGPYFGGDRPEPTLTAFPPEASGLDYRIDKNSPNDTVVGLTADNIADAYSGGFFTVTTKLYGANPANIYSLIGDQFKRPREAVGRTFARECLWYDAPLGWYDGSLPPSLASPTFPTELHATYQGETLTTPVVSSFEIVTPPSGISYRKVRTEAETWIAPNYKKLTFLGGNVRPNSSMSFYYLEYRPILLSADGQNCLFRREQMVGGSNDYPEFPAYATALQGYSTWVSTGTTQLWVDYWLLWEGIEYRITNPVLLSLTFYDFINYAALPGNVESYYTSDLTEPYAARFRSFVDDAIYVISLPLTLLVGAELIVNAPALSATNQIPVTKYTFTLDAGAGTATVVSESTTNYKMLFYPEYANFNTRIVAASFAP